MSILEEVGEKSWSSIKVLIEDVLAENWMDPYTVEMIRYQLDTGGKRIRPAIVLGVHRAFGGSDGDVLPFAAAVEIIHNASLVHDDIQDQDEFRRGRRAVWKEYSTSQAINLGDMLFTLAFETFMKSNLNEKTKLELIELTMRAVGELVNGQIREIMFRHSSEVTIDDYFEMVSGKTGSLFRLASRGAYIFTGNGSRDCAGDLGLIGNHLGNMFQVRDDIIDVFGLKEGRVAGCDVMEGKISILTSITMSRLGKGEKLDLVEMLRFPKDKKDEKLIARIHGIYKKADAFREAYNLYQKEREEVSLIPVMRDNRRLGAFISDIVNYISMPLAALREQF